MTINQRIQAAAGYLGRAAAGTAGGVLLATYTVRLKQLQAALLTFNTYQTQPAAQLAFVKHFRSVLL